jgi:proteasome lid subunit RPN8/RPN11
MDILLLNNRPLIAAMLDAAKKCSHPVEEEGGVILQANDDYLFIKVKNIYEGTNTAAGLYQTDQIALKNDVLPRLNEGWKFYASFHTHPQFSATPSSLDFAKLFEGFKYNVIYSQRTDMFSFSQWVANSCATFYVPVTTLEVLNKQ